MAIAGTRSGRTHSDLRAPSGTEHPVGEEQAHRHVADELAR
jgi:hypothetical protein